MKLLDRQKLQSRGTFDVDYFKPGPNVSPGVVREITRFFLYAEHLDFLILGTEFI